MHACLAGLPCLNLLQAQAKQLDKISSEMYALRDSTTWYQKASLTACCRVGFWLFEGGRASLRPAVRMHNSTRLRIRACPAGLPCLTLLQAQAEDLKTMSREMDALRDGTTWYQKASLAACCGVWFVAAHAPLLRKRG